MQIQTNHIVFFGFKFIAPTIELEIKKHTVAIFIFKSDSTMIASPCVVRVTFANDDILHVAFWQLLR